MNIDAHQHFWQYEPVKDAWITDEMNILKRDFVPADLQPLLEASGFDGCVAVQASQSEDETRFLIGLADKNPFIKGVVGWVDLKADNLEEQLTHFSSFPVVKGFRHVIQAEPDGFMLDPRFIQGVAALHDFKHTYDILIFERQLEEAVQMVGRLPEMQLIVDHIAKPDIRNRSFTSWKVGMTRLAAFPHVSVKLSGMVTEADWNHWKPEDLHPYMEASLELFGPDRLMIGSDWPVCLLAGNYNHVMAVVRDFIATLSMAEQAAILGLNAIRIYNLNK